MSQPIPLLTNFTNTIDDITVRGNTLTANVRDALTRASFDMELDQTSQLSMEFLDPNWKILESGFFLPGSTVDFSQYRLEIASIDTAEVGGVEGFTVKARASSVRLLKQQVGAFVLNNVSPQEYVVNRCTALGIKYWTHGAERRPQIARDVAQPGQSYSETPSDWTTFKRLAEEIGFVCFEAADTIYFGKPTWLITSFPDEVIANYKVGPESSQVLSIPECSKSLDSKVTTVSVEYEPKLINTVRPGKRLKLAGVPLFNGDYMVSGVGLDLLNPAAKLQVTAETPIDPEPRPPAAEGSSGSGGTVVIGGISIPSNFKHFKIGNVKPQTQYAANELGTIFGIKTIYGWAPGKYEHPKGLAIDLMINNISNGKAVGDKIAQYVIQNASRLGILYMIWYRRSWNPKRGTWASYSGDSPHTDHVHLSFVNPHTYRRP